MISVWCFVMIHIQLNEEGERYFIMQLMQPSCLLSLFQYRHSVYYGIVMELGSSGQLINEK